MGTGSGTWNYRVVRRPWGDGSTCEAFLAIHEAHYEDDEERPVAVTKEPARVTGDTPEELAEALEMMPSGAREARARVRRLLTDVPAGRSKYCATSRYVRSLTWCALPGSPRPRSPPARALPSRLLSHQIGAGAGARRGTTMRSSALQNLNKHSVSRRCRPRHFVLHLDAGRRIFSHLQPCTFAASVARPGRLTVSRKGSRPIRYRFNCRRPGRLHLSVSRSG